MRKLAFVALAAAVVAPMLSGAAAIELPHRNRTMAELRNAVREVASDPALELVEYVQTGGSQIIDAGFNLDDKPFWMQVESQSLVAYSSKVQIFLGAVQGMGGQWLGAVASGKVGNGAGNDQTVACDPLQRHSYRLTFESAGKSRAAVDGVSASGTQNCDPPSGDMYISSNGSFPSSMRIWHYSSSKGANYIPVKKGDGTYAMLDLATGTYPSITGTLTGGPIVRGTNQLTQVQMDNCWGFLITRQLRNAIRTATGDDELELVEYVETDGSQVIDAGFVTSDAPFWMQAEAQSLVAYSSKAQIFLGAVQGPGGQWLGAVATNMVGNAGDPNRTIECDPLLRHSYRLTFSATASRVTVDGISATGTQNYAAATVRDMYISSNGSFPSSMRIWHYSSSKGANYIPVKKGDGTYAMLDLATGTYPSITGTLTGGPVVANLVLQGTDEQYAAFTVYQIIPTGITIIFK